MATKNLLQRSALTMVRCKSTSKANRPMVDAKDVKTTDDEKRERELTKLAEFASLDEPPTTCCQSGCANCVFIVWAETLTSKMETQAPDVAKKIMDLIEDPSLKAYIEMELRLRGITK